MTVNQVTEHNYFILEMNLSVSVITREWKSGMTYDIYMLIYQTQNLSLISLECGYWLCIGTYLL